MLRNTQYDLKRCHYNKAQQRGGVQAWSGMLAFVWNVYRLNDQYQIDSFSTTERFFAW